MVITGLGMGGAERVVCDLADKMYEKGYIVNIAYLTGEVLTRPVHKEIELIKINLDSLLTLPKAYIRLLLLIKSYRPDVIHSHMVHANLLSRLVKLIIPKGKLISTAHSSNEGGRGRMLIYRATHNLADSTTNVSKEAALAFEKMRAVPHNGMRTIYNGIDLNKFNYSPNARAIINKELSLKEDYKIILAVGRFSEAKDYPNLLKSISILKTQATYPFKLIIAGDGELRSLIEHEIENLGLDEEVVLLGRRNDISKLMSAADLFVLSSKYEGFGLVVAEAMACECLVVVTDCGGVAEVLNNSDFLVPPCNSIALANKINYSLKMDEAIKKKNICKNIKYVQKNFSLDIIVDEWIELYNAK